MEVIALSIQQPWAWLIVNGYKDVENRTWKTKFRGDFYVHAGKKFDLDAWYWVEPYLTHHGISIPPKESLKAMCGGIVGRVTLTDCVSNHRSEWFIGPHAFVLEKPVVMSFEPMVGKLGFFKAYL